MALYSGDEKFVFIRKAYADDTVLEADLNEILGDSTEDSERRAYLTELIGLFDEVIGYKSASSYTEEELDMLEELEAKLAAILV